MVRALNEKARVYYGQCSNHHYVLLDPEAPAFQKNPPKASHNTVCRGCGPNYQVALETIKVGWVGWDDLNRGFCLAEPAGTPA